VSGAAVSEASIPSTYLPPSGTIVHFFTRAVDRSSFPPRFLLVTTRRRPSKLSPFFFFPAHRSVSRDDAHVLFVLSFLGVCYFVRLDNRNGIFRAFGSEEAPFSEQRSIPSPSRQVGSAPLLCFAGTGPPSSLTFSLLLLLRHPWGGKVGSASSNISLLPVGMDPFPPTHGTFSDSVFSFPK